MSTINEEIAELRGIISKLQDQIAVAERDGRSEAYIIALKNELIASKNELIASKNELIELRKKENILLGEKLRKGCEERAEAEARKIPKSKWI